MEQELAEDLVQEMIRIHGVDFYYMPRKLNNLDPLLTEDAVSSYNSAFLVDMYVKDFNGFQGGDFISWSSGPARVTDSFTLVVSRRTFEQEVIQENGQARPFEGDLVFFPLNSKLYKVTFVEHESVFYQFGALQVWELKCTIFDYSGETIATGVPEIDALTKGYDTNLTDFALDTDSDGDAILDEGDGLPILPEPEAPLISDENLNAQNDYFQEQGNNIVDWTELDPFAKRQRY